MAGGLTVVLATRNPGKISEIGAILADLPVSLVSLAGFPEIAAAREDGASFEENAAKKAAHVAERTGLASLADDSGLVVDALGGRPGVLSARFAGEQASHADNNRKLLQLVSGIPLEKRTARFVCVAALAVPGREVILRRGEIEGLITSIPAGTGGFGYDPIFYLPGFGATMAELDAAIKNSISHRAKAFAAIASVIREMLSP